MEDLTQFDAVVTKKYEIMRAKNEYLLQNFPNFPISETVIQNYRCTYKQGENSFSGKLWLTQNYLLFTENGNNTLRKQIPYMEIKTTAMSEGFLGYTCEMFIDLDNGLTVSFTNFYHFYEAFTLIGYLMDHSPCYYHIPAKKVEQKHASVDSYTKNQPKEPVHEGRWGSLATSFKENTVEKYEKPDVKLAEKCLEIADEIYTQGLDTRGALEEDARKLDRMERDLAETDHNVKKAKREIDAMGSVGGQMKKVVSGLVDKKLGAFDAPDRSAGSQEAEVFYDVPILVKHPNCDLEPAVLRFGVKDFFCASYPEGKKKPTLIRNYEYSYAEVSSVVIRVRPLHLDIRFWNEKETPRLRCISSHIQMIVNELALRTNSRVAVVFEPGTRKFEYNDEWLRNHPLQSNREKSSGSCLFERQSMRMTEVIVHAPSQITNAVAEQDKIVERLQETVSNIHVNTEDIKNEAKRQTDQTAHLHEVVDNTLVNSDRQTFKTRRLM